MFDAESLYQQGLRSHQKGDLREAARVYRQVIGRNPKHPGAWHFLGVIAMTQGDIATALEYLEKAIALETEKPVYWNNYGAALKLAERLHDAQVAFEKALALNPAYADAWANLGHLFFLQKMPQAEKALQNALKINPKHPDALRHLANEYVRQKRFFESRKFFEQYAAQVPESAELLHWKACLYGDTEEISTAKKTFVRAASLPGGKTVWRWKHLWYCPTFFENSEEIDAYWNRLNADLDEAIAEQNTYDWRTLASDGFTHSFNLPHHNRCCRTVLEKFSQLFAPSFPFERPEWCPEHKIRVGFLVTSGHEGGFLRFNEGLMNLLNPERFEVYLFYNETTRERYRNHSFRSNIHIVPFSWNFEEAVRTIRATRCDVIYYWKAGADAWSTFLPMCRLAPRQITSWGTHGTSGIPHLDAYVSWNLAEAPNAQEQYTEKLRTLDTSPLYEPFLTDAFHSVSRKELGLPAHGALYFCPQRPAKYHPMFDEYLKEILEFDASGHILLLMGHDPLLSEKFIRRFHKCLGEKNFRRMIFLPQQTVSQYYRLLSSSTVLLNSPIYSGEITLVDGLLCGIPSISQVGELLVQRYHVAYNHVLGTESLMAANREEYVSQTVKLGTDTSYRERIVQTFLSRRDILFENPQCIHGWEMLLTRLVEES